MPDRWTILIPDDLRAAAYGTILDAAEATPLGDVDAVTDAIASAVARVQRSVQAGNSLDTDTAKIPRSLKAVAVRIALYQLMELIGLALSDDQKETRRNDNSDLLRIADRKVRVEPPDTADATAGPQNPGSWNSENKLIMRSHPVPAPTSQWPRLAGNYANPDAPEDRAP